MKSLGPLLAGVPGYLGAAIREDGGVALVLDPNHLLKAYAAGARAGAGTPRRRAAPNVLVVDDQFTVRELQRSILETAGYRVETARDGREALGAHRAGPPTSTWSSPTSQMPAMDGFELLRAIRRMPERAVAARRDRHVAGRRGATGGAASRAGADAYIVKERVRPAAPCSTPSARMVQTETV